MDGVIFIRTLTEDQEKILENVKLKKEITANTKAIQYIISDYARSSINEEDLRKEITELKRNNFELLNKIDEYEMFFKMLNKLQNTSTK